MSTCIVYLASPLTGYNSILLTGEKRIDMMYMSLKNVTSVLKLPVIMFHEDLTDNVMSNMKKIYNNISFEKMDMVRDDLPFNHPPCKTSGDPIKCICKPDSPTTRNKHCWRPKGYLMMCRFFSGELQQHPALDNYDSYVRFDDDSFLISPFIQQEDFLEKMNNYDYVFRAFFYDRGGEEGLVDFTKDFCLNNGLDWNSITGHLTKSGVLDSDGKYTGMAPYNNFHFSKLSLWRNPLVKKYVDELQAVGGCLQRGWMDANIHAMISFVLMPLIGRKPFMFTAFGYRHSRHFPREGGRGIRYLEEERFFPLIDIKEIDKP